MIDQLYNNWHRSKEEEEFSLASHLRRDSLGVHNFLEHVDHVKELTVNVTDDDDWFLDSQHVGLALFTSIRRYMVRRLLYVNRIAEENWYIDSA